MRNPDNKARMEPVSYTHLDVYKRQEETPRRPFVRGPLRPAEEYDRRL